MTFQAGNLSDQGRELGETHRCLRVAPARSQWSPSTQTYLQTAKRPQSRKLLINPPLHQIRLLIQALLVSRVSGIKSTYLLHPWQLSWHSVNLEAPVSPVTLAEP